MRCLSIFTYIFTTLGLLFTKIELQSREYQTRHKKVMIIYFYPSFFVLTSRSQITAKAAKKLTLVGEPGVPKGNLPGIPTYLGHYGLQMTRSCMETPMFTFCPQNDARAPQRIHHRLVSARATDSLTCHPQACSYGGLRSKTIAQVSGRES